MLAPGSEFTTPGPWLDFALENLALYPAYVAELREESGLPIDYRTAGGFDVAFSEGEWRGLERRASLQRALGIPVETLPGKDLHIAGLASGVQGALYYPGDGQVDPRMVLAALRTACERRGVVVRTGAPVQQIVAERGLVRVITAGGEHEAAVCVVAAGAWSSGIRLTVDGREEPLPEVVPVKGFLIGYQLEAGTLPAITRHEHTYILQRGSGFTIAGSTEERIGFDRSANDDLVEELAERARRLLPGLLGTKRADVWSGLRPAMADGRPRIGALADGRVWLAYGHYRNGILMAPGTAQRVAAGIQSTWAGRVK
jgi:glycine oxidase